MKFPWKDPKPTLKDNKRVAYCRLLDQFQRLSKTALWPQYIKSIDDHLTAGFIEEVDEYVFDDPRVYYIPHQAVIKESSSTTKLRIVFDASSRARDACSLNDCLHQGPTLLPELVGILLRARLHRFLLIADVEKAFHQVRLQHTERDATRFLWLQDPWLPPSSSNLRIFRFTRVPFGINASPFLLSGSIQFYLRHQANHLSNEIIHNTYVDNVVLGAASNDEALQKYHALKTTFNSMHMNLREFVSNSHVVNLNIAPADRASNPSNATLLGIHWLYSPDWLVIPIKTLKTTVNSKRTALRALASTFDPLGLLTPFFTPIKVFIQDLWGQNLGWDTPFTQQQSQQWSKLMLALQHPLPHISRLVMPANTQPNSYHLCVFADASQRVYACCAYLVTHSPATVTSQLVMAKSHLNSTKPLTIPRAELLAILISVRMTQYLLQQRDINITAIHLFSDSLIALHWVHTNRELKTFVKNRVSAIKKIIDTFRDRNIHVQFRHVVSQDNPADHATRGLATKDANGSSWWTGPSFLLHDPSRWPDSHIDFDVPPSDNEVISEFAFAAIEDSFQSVLPFHVTNSYTRLVRITAYILKFIRTFVFNRISTTNQSILQLKLPNVISMSSSGGIQASDFEAAETQLVLAHYSESEQDLRRLRIRPANTYRGANGLIHCHFRVGPLETAPILLVPAHRLTYLIILHFHLSQHHAGVHHTITALRSHYYIPSARRHIAKVLRRCVSCKKIAGQAYRYPQTPMLPPERVTRSYPFQNIGLDYLGPLTSIRNDTSGKTWICLFTCMATRAIHLEVVLDNSAQEFLLAFRRFVARRGAPTVVYSDNAPTFHAAENAIQSAIYAPVSWQSISSYCASHRITWHFITPLSPWKGGFYERLVALFKSAYRKSVGRAMLTLSQLQTIVAEIEATLNSRPITPFREQDTFAYLLRPIDFLAPKVNAQLPFETHHNGDSPDPRHQLVNWHREMLRVLDHFWDLWYSDYLAALRDRHQEHARTSRSTTLTPNLGDIVIIADDKLPRGHWPYGLVSKLVVSNDHNVRSVEVRTSGGKSLIRSISHLIPLELNAYDYLSNLDTRSESLSASNTRSIHDQSSPTPDSTPPRVQPSRRAKSMHKFIRSS